MSARVDPPHQADEITTLRSFLDYYRGTIRVKTDGLDRHQLAVALAPSDLTLGGLLKHLAFVETWWFVQVLAGQEPPEPFASVDWEADEDWDWHSALNDSPDELRGLFDSSVTRANRSSTVR